MDLKVEDHMGAGRRMVQFVRGHNLVSDSLGVELDSFFGLIDFIDTKIFYNERVLSVEAHFETVRQGLITRKSTPSSFTLTYGLLKSIIFKIPVIFL